MPDTETARNLLSLSLSLSLSCFLSLFVAIQRRTAVLALGWNPKTKNPTGFIEKTSGIFNHVGTFETGSLVSSVSK